MRKVDWARKLTSRKLWMSVCSFTSMMVVATGGTDNQAAQVAALIMAGATVLGYVIGEGLTDAAYSNSSIDANTVQDITVTGFEVEHEEEEE